MSIELHPNCKARITDILEKALPTLDVQHGKFLSRSSEGVFLIFAADQALPQQGKIHDQLVAIVDEHPLVEFVLDTLALELRDAAYTETDTQKLTTVQGFQDAKAVASRLIDAFVSLPNRYRLTFSLPNELWPCLPMDKDQWTLGPASSRLIRSSKQLADKMPMPKSGEVTEGMKLGLLSLLDTTPAWDEGAVYLQVDADGFIGPYGGSIPDLEARRFVRAFSGLGVALQLFEPNSNYSLHPPRQHYFVHRQSDENWLLERRLELDDSVSRGLSRLQMAKLVNTPEKQKTWCPRLLKEVADVVSGGARAEPILLAAQWYFDSVTGPDQLLSYVQAMVSLEIILGDKAISKEIGLNELLRNRCAYLIGSSHEDRAEIYKAFGDIYEIRSQIVHQGKHRLNMRERALLNRLRWMCRSVIQKEVDLLVADNKKKDAASSAAT